MKEVNELKTGMQNTTKEYETHKQDVLGHFLAEAGNKVDMLGSYDSYFRSYFINDLNLDADAVEAQEAYRKVVTYFGETSKTMPPETFFPMFDRFIKAYGKAETDLEKWNLLQQKNLEKREQVSFDLNLVSVSLIFFSANERRGRAPGSRSSRGRRAN